MIEYADLKNDSIGVILDELSSIQELIQIWKEELYDDEEGLMNYYNDLCTNLERIFSSVLLIA